jgi:hypothetical protein
MEQQSQHVRRHPAGLRRLFRLVSISVLKINRLAWQNRPTMPAMSILIFFAALAEHGFDDYFTFALRAAVVSLRTVRHRCGGPPIPRSHR